MGNCLQQPGQLRNRPQKSMRVSLNPLIKLFCTMTDPAAETKSIGLLADALLSWFLHRHLDNFIMTGQILPIYRDYTVKTVPSGRKSSRPSIGTLQKRMPTPTQTATTHTTGPLGVRGNAKSQPVFVRESYHDVTVFYSLSGLGHLDSFTMT